MPNRRKGFAVTLKDLTTPGPCPQCQEFQAMVEQPCSRFAICLVCEQVVVESKESLEYIDLDKWQHHAAGARLSFGGTA